MATHENGKSTFSDPAQALVEVPSNAGAGSAAGNPFAGIGAPQEQDVLKGGMDRSGLFNALRRRWLLATCMSLLIGSTVGAALYFLFPQSFTATAQYKVAESPLTLLDANSANQTRDYDIFKSTQIAYIRSPLVLNAALRDSVVNKLPMFDDIEDKVDWLRGELVIAYPNDSEILTIAMSGAYPKEDLKKVVEAVSRAYYEEVIFAEDGNRQKPLQILRGTLASLSDQIHDKMVAYQNLAEDSGTSFAYDKGLDPETKFMLSEALELQKSKGKLESRLVDLAMQYRIIEQQIKDPDFLKGQIDKALQGDPNVAQMEQEMTGIDMQIRQLQSIAKRGESRAVRGLLKQRQSLQAQMNQMREQMRAQYASQQGNEPNTLLKQQTLVYQISRASTAQEMQRLDTKLTELREQLLEKAKNNTDLMLRIAEIDQLKQVQQGIATKIQNLRVELKAPKRIQPIGSKSSGAASAETNESRNALMRMAISGIGGLGSLLLTCLGIGYMEFSRRKLNGPDQIDEGLGIRVIGTLPSLSGRKALNANHPVLAQLNESIDSVRTALMHESTTKRRQLILVTSPATSEGRTTVASQLAASLARAGRRTLLIDGDLRRPSLHTLFNLPLEDGLSEVLRAETEVTDVIRPTQAEGLWVMTAGYCEGEAVKALATDQAQPIFEKLRSEYDFIIIDGPPVLGLSDSLLFGQHCDGAILSVLRDHSVVPKIHQTAQLLKSVGVRLIGSVINGVPTKADDRVMHLQQVTARSQQPQLETSDS